MQHHGADPAAPAPRPETPAAPRAQAAPPHHAFLASAACKDLSEALRTAAARGVGAQGQDGLRQEWQRRCEEEDRVALQRHQTALQDARLQREARERSTEAAALRQRDEQQARVQHCAELGRILDVQRGRADLDAGRRHDLQLSGERYRARCRGVPAAGSG
jgi:hypothetical protein